MREATPQEHDAIACAATADGDQKTREKDAETRYFQLDWQLTDEPLRAVKVKITKSPQFVTA